MSVDDVSVAFARCVSLEWNLVLEEVNPKLFHGHGDECRPLVVSTLDISALEWAFMQRALHGYGRGVPFSAIIGATGQFKDNVRRAADSLRRRGYGVVIPDPEDRRARLFKLTKRGENLTRHIKGAFEQEMLRLLGARHRVSGRVRGFNRHLWHATGFFKSGDLANAILIAHREDNRSDSRRHTSTPTQ